MNELYLRSYSTLGLKPGSNWQEIRGAYRALIKKWHPDRFQQDSKNRKISEEETMEITRAYKVLADYYREHGSTPTNPATAPTAPARAPEHMHRAATPVDVSANDAHAGHPIPSPVESAQWKTLFVLSAIALLFYLWLSDPADRDPGVDALPKNMVQDADLPAAGGKATSHPADRFFTLGSKLGVVYAIQGVPSKTEQGVWHYGKSRVYFVNGSVSQWDSHPENPLQASLDIDPVIAKKDFFERGSTKGEVRILHGTPWRQTEREWVYGSSRIFFSADVVTGWEESPLNPLKVQK